MYRCAQCVSTYTAQYDHISSREHAWLESAQLRIARSGVQKKKKMSSTRHVSFLATPDTDHQRKFSLSCLICLPAVLSLTVLSFGTRSIYTLRRFPAEWRTHWKSHLPQVMSPKWSSPTTSSLEELSLTGILGQIYIKLRKEFSGDVSQKSCHWRYGRIWTSWCRDALHPRKKDTLRLLKTRILKMENYENAGFTTVYTRAREKYWFFSKTHGFGETRSRGNAEEKGQVHNVLKLITQEEKAWCHVPLKTRERQGDLMQYFRQGATNRDSSSRLLFSSMLIRQNWEDLFWRAIEIICSVRQDLNSWSKNIKSDLSIAVSMSFSNKLTLKDWNWNYKIPIMDFLNPEEKKLDYKKNYLWRKKCFERLKYEIFTRWEKWRELKNYELTNSKYKN